MSIERLKELFHELNCIQYRSFKLASGRVSNYKIFCDPLFKNRDAGRILGETGYRMFQDIEGNKKYDIVGVVTGGHEFAKIVAEMAGRNVIGVDPHKNRINGTIRERNVCYFEDTVTSGGSIIKCQNMAKRHFPFIEDTKALSIVYREEDGIENLRKEGIELKYILTKSDLGIKPS